MTNEKFTLPKELVESWQEILNLVVHLADARAALIMHLEKDYLKTFLGSENDENPYKIGEVNYLPHSGLYCEKVIDDRKMLLVADARKSVEWENNPDMKLNMISYLGFPISMPDGTPFGTICLLDDRENVFSEDIINIMKQMRNLLENNLLVEKQLWVERSLTRKLRESEKKYKLITENTLDIIWTIDLKEKLTYISPAIEKHTGYTPEEYRQLSLEKMFTTESFRVLKTYMNRVHEHVRQGKPICTFRKELRGVRKDGSIGYVEVALSGIYSDDGKLIELVGVSRNVTERRKLEDKILYLATHDALTGLPNIRVSNDFLGTSIEKAQKNSTKIAVIFVDINGFKPVNDTYGHSVGDLLLKHVAKILKKMLPPSAIVSRIGGDEFLIIINNMRLKNEVSGLVEKMIDNVMQPFIYRKQSITIGISVGISIYPDDGTQVGKLINLADKAMYTAKKFDKNKYMFVS